ncbi:MAG: M1 family peptidase [Chitinophagia bacterium]|nr:M1 family peptidase [Chitinophagia bacterium]
MKGMKQLFRQGSYYSLCCIVAGLLFMGCGNNTATTPETTTVQPTKAANGRDAHTLSNADSIAISHLNLNIEVDPTQRKIKGAATWDIDNSAHKLKLLRLDTYALLIDSVLADGARVSWSLGQFTPHLGKALLVPVTENTHKVTVYYSTTDSARALQWLQPSQTHDKKQPFLYTQSESIYARSWLPCPDGPGIRYTYEARVKVPANLLALMSATNPQAKNDSGIYHFTMEKPIPAYLMALAVGDLVFKPINGRTGIYAEPGMAEQVKYEFAEVGEMVSTAEKLYGPYRWGRYDVVVLPPGFPIGGMENPRLTFCTPTVIAGDRSLVTLIAHELAHSWSGNLVTNATWNDFWLNEGFTVYFERRIMEQMKGKSYADMLWELGYQDLTQAVAEIGRKHPDTWLKLDLTGRDPDEGLTDIAYEKGAHFLELIERRAGRARFDSFLNGYFSSNAFKTITTEQFLAYLNEHLVKEDTSILSHTDIQQWVYGPGTPADCPRAGNERFALVDSARSRFLAGKPAASLNTRSWTTHEWLHFLRKLPPDFGKERMAALDKAFHFTNATNAEIADLWFILAIRAEYLEAMPAMERFLSTVGRRKFLDPLYSEMKHSQHLEGMAKEYFEKYKNNYHPLAQEHIEAILKED